MTESIIELDPVKRCVGRPCTTGIHAVGNEYHRLYNQAFKTDIVCECGAVIKKHNLALHKKTKKHLWFIYHKPAEN